MERRGRWRQWHEGSQGGRGTAGGRGELGRRHGSRNKTEAVGRDLAVDEATDRTIWRSTSTMSLGNGMTNQCDGGDGARPDVSGDDGTGAARASGLSDSLKLHESIQRGI
ncbi:hypothetical protein GUJ93_ZPchr0002g24677 [Zizania palustris]|uniref:Uncharacterized protein n=1 Tax=Zizania palustris TaxID=103762 RepID=A0A8J5RUY6_ZIZPA|nr:hypothetical protein GUJ93_ZPchr0002g24677 [Zizania palustris]